MKTRSLPGWLLTVAIAAFAATAVGQELPPPAPMPDERVGAEPPPPQPAPRIDSQRQPPPPQPSSRATSEDREEAVEHRLRGPIHEAYAMPVTPDARESFAVDEPPPEPLDELPPPAAPIRDDAQAVWIPGYWGWDEGYGYVWVSGVWRYPPPEMRWSPGYWSQANGSVRWVPGCWTRGDVDQLAYLPEPPARREEDSGPPPDENHFWVPGGWVYEGHEYRWREGFWAPARQDWVWVPACYLWTPRGYLFADGYWDHPPVERGVLFAPATPTPGRPFTPEVVINVEGILSSLFIQPS